MVVAQTIVFGVVIGLYVVPVAVYLVYRGGKWMVQKWRLRKTRHSRSSRLAPNLFADHQRRRRRKFAPVVGHAPRPSSAEPFKSGDDENRKTDAETSPLLLRSPHMTNKTNESLRNVRKTALSPQEMAVQIEVDSVLAASQSLSRSRSCSQSDIERFVARGCKKTAFRDHKSNINRRNSRPDGCSTSDEEHERYIGPNSEQKNDRARPNTRRDYARHRNDDRSFGASKTKARTSRRRYRAEWHMPSTSTDVSEAIGSSISESQHSAQSIGDKVLRRNALLYGVDMI